MRHRVAHRKLGRVTEHRISLLRNQATALLRHEHIETTVPKARELRPFVERLITVAKRGIAAGDAEKKLMNARRHVAQDLADVKVVDKLFDEVAPRFQARPGGYTRLLRIGPRAATAPTWRASSWSAASTTRTSRPRAAPPRRRRPRGVRGRLQAAASRLRGKRAADADKRVAEPAPAEPKKRVTKKAKKTDE